MLGGRGDDGKQPTFSFTSTAVKSSMQNSKHEIGNCDGHDCGVCIMIKCSVQAIDRSA